MNAAGFDHCYHTRLHLLFLILLNEADSQQGFPGHGEQRSAIQRAHSSGSLLQQHSLQSAELLGAVRTNTPKLPDLRAKAMG